MRLQLLYFAKMCHAKHKITVNSNNIINRYILKYYTLNIKPENPIIGAITNVNKTKIAIEYIMPAQWLEKCQLQHFATRLEGKFYSSTF